MSSVLQPDEAVVIPADGTLRETARLLLDIAGDPYLVRTINGGTAFQVPVSIADEYSRRVAPQPRRRGRAPKTEEE